MPRSRIRRKNRGATAARLARSARAQARQARELFGPLTPEQTIEAEGYLIDAIEATIEQLAAEIVAMGNALTALPLPAPVDSAAFVEAATIDDEIAHVSDLCAELEAMREAVRNRRPFTVPGTLGVMTVRHASRKLLTDAAHLGTPVDAAALAEAKRREAMIARWLMNLEGDVEADAAPPPPPARP